MVKEMNSKEYWRKRLIALSRKTWQKEEEIQKEIAEIYERSLKDIKRELEVFYARYANDHSLTMEEAKKRVNEVELSDFDTRLTHLIKKEKLTEKEEEQLKLLRIKFATTRLDLLVKEIELKLIEGYGEQQITMDEWLKRVAFETYRETSGIIGNFMRLPATEIYMIVQNPWSGVEFSDILWKNKEQLVFNLKKVITSGLIKGDSIQKMTKALNDEIGGARYASQRIIRTETGQVMNRVTLKSYDDNGLEQYEFSAHIDGRTSPVCKKLNGMVYKVSEGQVGVNMPPMHPNCRSAILPVVE